MTKPRKYASIKVFYKKDGEVTKISASKLSANELEILAMEGCEKGTVEVWRERLRNPSLPPVFDLVRVDDCDFEPKGVTAGTYIARHYAGDTVVAFYLTTSLDDVKEALDWVLKFPTQRAIVVYDIQAPQLRSGKWEMRAKPVWCLKPASANLCLSLYE